MNAPLPKFSRCSMCGKDEPYSPSLAFVELAKETCRECGMYACAHPGHPEFNPKTRFPANDHEYVPHVRDYAWHYCGCQGWD